MIASNWDDWLVQTIEHAEPDGVSIWYLGCNGFVLKASDGTTIFIDPYFGTGHPPRTIRMIPVPMDPNDVQECDAILASHGHTDHLHGPSQAPILANTGAPLYASKPALQVAYKEEKWLDEWAVTDDQLVAIDEDESVDIGAFTVSAGPANDPDAEAPLSFIVEHEAGTFFHGGDSKPTEAFLEVGKAYDIDLAVVAIGTVGNMYDDDHEVRSRTRWYADENQAVEIANDLQAARLLPSHWDMWKGVSADPTSLHKHIASWPYPKRLEIVEIGDRIEL